ncbi:MAG: amino acid ABC transporter substrate-binding protein [Desulfobacteraceae bacterium]|nr:amino acid ABC transporter substrate-binding protein [Desulfobacteraceae bacterium]
MAKDVTLVAGLSLPPYIIQEANTGIEHDIVKEALVHKGHTLKLKYVPFARLVADYKKHDGAITINESSGAKGHYSGQVITYQNYAISLKKKNVSIDSIQDLKDKKVVAFNSATKYLGEEFAKVAKANPKYEEQGKQLLQVKMLYSGRSDAIVSDINIFKYYRKQVTDMDTSAKIVLHEIFPGTDYKVLFNDASLRDDFNAGLKELKASGRYQAIKDSYVK